MRRIYGKLFGFYTPVDMDFGAFWQNGNRPFIHGNNNGIQDVWWNFDSSLVVPAANENIVRNYPVRLWRRWL